MLACSLICCFSWSFGYMVFVVNPTATSLHTWQRKPFLECRPDKLRCILGFYAELGWEGDIVQVTEPLMVLLDINLTNDIQRGSETLFVKSSLFPFMSCGGSFHWYVRHIVMSSNWTYFFSLLLLMSLVQAHLMKSIPELGWLESDLCSVHSPYTFNLLVRHVHLCLSDLPVAPNPAHP